MITIYQLDAQGVFVGEREIDPMGPLPVPLAMTAPPKTTGDQVAWWNGSKWEKLAERPALPPGPTAEEVLAQARAAASMSRLDFAKLALREGWITAAEAKAWVPGNALPQIVTDIIAQHIDGADKQDIAEINALGQLVVNRNDLLLRLLMMSKKVTDAQMDAHFIAAAQVKA